MKSIIIAIFCCAMLPIASTAQTKQKAEKEFVNELNNLLKKSKDNDHWDLKGNMTIEKGFAIDKQGLLSVTVRFTEEGNFILKKMVAPVKNAKEVLYDLYLILAYSEKEVTVYQSELNSATLKEVNKNIYFHLGAPGAKNGRNTQKKLEQLLNNILKYY